MNFLQKIYKKSKEQKGFTLVEMIVVLVIIAILAAITIPALIKYIDKAKEKQIVIDARTAYLAAETAISEAYAAGKPDLTNKKLQFGTTDGPADAKDVAEEAEKLTGISKTYQCDVEIDDKWKIKSIKFTEDKKIASMDLASSTGGAWDVKDE